MGRMTSPGGTRAQKRGVTLPRIATTREIRALAIICVEQRWGDSYFGICVQEFRGVRRGRGQALCQKVVGSGRVGVVSHCQMKQKRGVAAAVDAIFVEDTSGV